MDRRQALRAGVTAALVTVTVTAAVTFAAGVARPADMFSDSFNSATSFPSGAWSAAQGTGNWSVVTEGSGKAVKQSGSASPYIVVAGNATWTDYSYSIKVKVDRTDTPRAGLVARYKDTSNYYAAYLYNNRLYVDRRANSSTSTLASPAYAYAVNVYHTVTLTLAGSSIKAYVNGTLVAQLTDSTLASGKIGIYGTKASAWYDDALVTGSGTPSPTPTTASPSASPSVSPSPSASVSPSPPPSGGPDAGLKGPVAQPALPTGTTRNITSYGATPGNSADDDSIAIQNTINASSAGDQVLIPNGVFHLKTRKIALKTGVSVRGASRDGAVLHAAFTAQADGKNSYVFYAGPGTNNLTLSNFTTTSNGSTSGTTGLNYSIWLGDGDSACQECNFNIAPVYRIRVTGLNVHGYLKMGLNIRNGHDITMDNNLVHSALSDSGGGFGYGIMLGYDQTANNWIHHNTIERGSGRMRHGILLQYRANHNLIEHNIVRNLSEDGIDLHGEDEYSNEVRYNVVHGSARAGLGVGNTGGSTNHGASGPNNWIHHNEVYNSLKGLHLIMESHNTWIEFNNFHGNEEFGIQVYNGGGDRLTIRCNDINGNEVGMRLEESAGSLIECNNMSGNVSESLRVTGTVSSYTIRRNDFRGAEVTVDSSSGVYQNNCEDGNGNTSCLSGCP